jgi:hypothetical protein
MAKRCLDDAANFVSRVIMLAGVSKIVDNFHGAQRPSCRYNIHKGDSRRIYSLATYAGCPQAQKRVSLASRNLIGPPARIYVRNQMTCDDE